jgi:hypothetical protein
MTELHQALDALNAQYESIHTAKEDAFWRSMMGLGGDPERNRHEAERLHVELQRFLSDAERLKALRALEGGAAQASEEDRVALKGWIRTLEAHTIESAEARALAEEILADEGALASKRRGMKLGYRDAEQGYVEASPVKLRLMIGTDADPMHRESAWEGLREVERFVLEHGFVELVRKRNQLGRMLGGVDYYDARVRRTEGMSKDEIFGHLDELERLTRDAAKRSVEGLGARVGAGELRPWNMRYLISGDVSARKDPYFPFSQALERWGRTFAGLGIDYRGATMVLDLVDRKGKYENGFMHGPVPCWRKDGVWRPARIHFTANAIPGAVGSGYRATQTLFHEGGHAAHFANIDMPSPSFAQEFAPTSVAFAETQSMFLDSLLDDADWMTRYAKTEDGRPMPFEIIEAGIRATQPFAAWNLRMMLAVCYGEKAIYEIPDEALSADTILAALRDVERRLLFLEEGSPSPVLSVPHLTSGESSAYYHGYVMAEMAVQQTRAFFLERDGHLVDNPKIGPELQRAYWAPGNSKLFQDYLRELTGEGLEARYLAQEASRSVEEALEDARGMIARLAQVPSFEGEVELNGSIDVIHGDELVCSTDKQPFDGCAATFARWIEEQTAQRGA